MISEDTGLWRFAIFVFVLCLMAALEFVIPKRKLVAPKARRWVTNIFIAGLGSGLVRLMGAVAVPIIAMAAAVWAESQNIGLFYVLSWPYWLVCVLSIVILDFAIYLQHVASHHIPILWRLHRVHHSDRDIDVTTAVRFHPIEIGLSMLYKVAIVIALGVPVFAVFLFEVILNACAMFNHSNIKLPLWLDQVLRRIIVTPDMHRVHHSIRESETNSNYGFNLSIWDMAFRTYKSQPKDGHDKMTIGLPYYQDSNPTKLGWSLYLPVLKLLSQSDNKPKSEEGNTSE